MAIIVEDGTGKVDSESYISVADADTYFSARGFATWATMSTGEKEQALRRGTDYMQEMYRTRWAGVRMTATQALDWPRYDVPMRDAPGGYAWPAYYPVDAVPAIVARACAELAYRAAHGELAPDVDREKLRVKVGPIETEYSRHAVPYKRFRAVDALLAPLFAFNGGSVGVVRS
jgi:hypothetical protein